MKTPVVMAVLAAGAFLAGYHFPHAQRHDAVSAAASRGPARTEASPIDLRREASASDGRRQSPRRLPDVLETSAPALLRARLIEFGHRAAQENLEEALRAIDGLRDPVARRSLVQGIFTHVAATKPPYQALQRAKSLAGADEDEAMRVLVSTWTGTERSGNLVQLGTALMRSEPESPAAEAWLEAFRSHPAYGEWLGEKAAPHAGRDADQALAAADDLDGWERRRFVDRLITSWADDDPRAAWQWARANTDELSPETMPELLDRWFVVEPDAAEAAFRSFDDTEVRADAAVTMIEAYALQFGTEAALEWADSLESQTERDAAHDRLYEVTPRGIGAVLRDEGGSVTVQDTMPGTPAALAGLRKGDRIVEVDTGDGRFRSLSSGLENAVELIRGEADSPLRLRILRRGGNGAPVEQVIDLRRRQLIMPGESGS